jgi:diguanylate cyclase (GGDEF)-like protein
MMRETISAPPPTVPDQILREDERLAELERLDVLDSPREEAFDRIARLIRNIFDLPIGIVSMIDGHRQWYKAIEGLSDTEVALQETFCRYAMQSANPLVVEDATQDARFANNPKVTQAPHIRFYAGAPLRTVTGHNIGTMCAIGYEPRSFSKRELLILEDLTHIAMRELELRELAMVDGLTGILTRRAFREQAGQAVAFATRHKHELGCIVFDLDHFKTINDSHGHAAGDKVLVAVTNICRQHLRSSDLFGRIGGEEFAVLLPHTTSQGQVDVAEKLRAAIAALKVELDGTYIPVSASLGIAALEPGGIGIDNLLANADVALYLAKAAGRNKCVAWRSTTGDAKDSRRRVLKAGRIVFNAQRSTIDCTVKSLGTGGAGLAVTSAVGVPERFLLEIPSERLVTQCRIVAQTERHIEVAFS